MHSDGGRAAVFAALDTGRRADAVVRRLADGIALGILAPDEQLPSETELADTFGVSPVTVREALTILREQGLVATRRGRGGGSFVRDVHDVRGDGAALRTARAAAGGEPVGAARPGRPLRRGDRNGGAAGGGPRG